MKANISFAIKAHLLRGAFYVLVLSAGTSLAFFRPEAPANVSHKTLSFAERVTYQRAIEDVYWRHRIWPKEHRDPKPPLDSVMPQAQLEKKVADYLRKSHALEDHWQRPITVEQLQAEMDRMAHHTKQPDVLRELFAALGNDPFIIAECLARPALSDRLLTDLSAHDHELLTSWRSVADNHMPGLIAEASANYTLPKISDGSGCMDDTWTDISTVNAPSARAFHTAVWTGSEMIVWGGRDGFNVLNTGGRYNPATDSWTATHTPNGLDGRYYHTAVWTGSEMIIWGGLDGNINVGNTGERYNPNTDSWAAIAAGPLEPRYLHTAIWVGSEMIVWGGYGFGGPPYRDGARYNPSNSSWTPTSLSNAPSPRYAHTAVWTGSEMIIWGGNIADGTGGRYNPSTDSWTATSTNNRPTVSNHTTVWTGSKMIVWGGFNYPNVVNTGGRYDPGTDSWTATTTTNAPQARWFHTAVWTGSEMIVWGGCFGNPCSNFVDTGGRYDPGTDSWTATSTTNAPSARAYHTAVWTGSEMIVWGGQDDSGNNLNTGGRYCAQSASPTPTPTATATATASPTPTATATATATFTPTPTPNGCSVVSTYPTCGSVVMGSAPTYFTVQLSDAVDQATLQASDFMVNGTPADSVIVISGKHTIFFHFNTSPALQGQNTMHISAGAFNCGQGPVEEFTCTFTYQPSTPTPTPTLTPRPSPTPRFAPTPRVRPTPPPRP